MAQFQPIVLNYLEHYLPDLYAHLKAERQLRGYMDTLVDRLYEKTDRTKRRLEQEYPDRHPDQLAIYAEQMAIATVLPTEPLPELTEEYSESEGVYRFVEDH